MTDQQTPSISDEIASEQVLQTGQELAYPPSPSPPPPSPDVAPSPPPPPPPPQPPDGWCHQSCPQSADSTSILNQYWRSTANVLTFTHADIATPQSPEHYNLFHTAVTATQAVLWRDADQLRNATWYRFVGEAGDRMPTDPPAYESCGTRRTARNLTHPMPGDHAALRARLLP